MQNNTNNRQYEPRDFGFISDMQVLGRTTQPVRMGYTKTGKPVVNLNLVTTRRVVQRDDEGKIITDRNGKAVAEEVAKFIKVTVWPHEKRAEWLANNLNVPGFVVFASGRAEPEAYQTREGETRADIVVHTNDVQVVSFPKSYEGPTVGNGQREKSEAPDWGAPNVPQQPQRKDEPSLEDLFNGV